MTQNTFTKRTITECTKLQQVLQLKISLLFERGERTCVADTKGNDDEKKRRQRGAF